MKNRFLVILVILVVAVFYFRHRTKIEPIEVAPVAAPRKKIDKVETAKPTPPTQPARVEAPPAVTPMPQPAQPPAPTAIPTGVPYVIDDTGMAIAYGDVLIGMPKGEIPRTGSIRPSAIQFWPSGEIPFHIQPSLPRPERVYEAFEAFRGTPISFVPYTNQPDALVFEAKPGHCRSYLGRVGGTQPVWLSDNCEPSAIIHEIMHALGFIHEHSRTDRDEYVEVVWGNIEEQYKSQFLLVPIDLMVTARGFAFDPESVMIYDPNSFARAPGLETLRSKIDRKVAPSKTLSKQDIERLFKFYR